VIESYRTAQVLAQKLLAQARGNEPKITADLQKIVQEVSAEMAGLEHRFKLEESLIRKLIDYVGDDFQKLGRKAKNINDVLRYTFVLPFEVYAEVFQGTVERLSKLGYQIPEHRIWNAWQTIGERFDKGYRGINITVISSQNQKFELQFHTEESFRLKTETHILYEELRQKGISEKRQVELIEECRKAAKGLERPQGV
jgi:hypothetical protein